MLAARIVLTSVYTFFYIQGPWVVHVMGWYTTLFSSPLVHSKVLAPVQSRVPSLSVFGWSGALTFGYGCTVHVGVDVGARDVEVDVIYISFT